MRKYVAYPIIFMLIVSILVNKWNLSSRGKLFAHELNDICQILSVEPAILLHIRMHHRNNATNDGADLDMVMRLCLHSAGQYRPFLSNPSPQILDQMAKETLSIFISVFIPEIIPDLSLRPPRTIS